MPSDKVNLITAKVMGLIFTVRCRFSPTDTAVCTMHTSLMYLCPPLCVISFADSCFVVAQWLPGYICYRIHLYFRGDWIDCKGSSPTVLRLVMLCDRLNIAESKVELLLHF